jgi:hypothetical protein
MLAKPPDIEADPFKNAKWDEITKGRDFSQADSQASNQIFRYQLVALVKK